MVEYHLATNKLNGNHFAILVEKSQSLGRFKNMKYSRLLACDFHITMMSLSIDFAANSRCIATAQI